MIIEDIFLSIPDIVGFYSFLLSLILILLIELINIKKIGFLNFFISKIILLVLIYTGNLNLMYFLIGIFYCYYLYNKKHKYMLITLFSILDYLFIYLLIYYLLSLFLFIILNIRYFLIY